jgi:5-hydroxyisourate hydrolase
MSQLTTHILDTTLGKPARGVTIILFEQQSGNWKEMARGVTNQDGRITDLLDKKVPLPSGEYKLLFETKAYFDSLSTTSFYPYIEIVFNITGSEHYHVPLLLNAFGYTTYRGS